MTLLALNELSGYPLEPGRVGELAASLGSDIPFFLQENPAIATGRGEKITPWRPFRLPARSLFGFGSSRFRHFYALGLWNNASFPAAAKKAAGWPQKLVSVMLTDLVAGGQEFYNSLEAPALHKHPLLALMVVQLSRERCWRFDVWQRVTNFSHWLPRKLAENLLEKFKVKFGVNLLDCNVGYGASQ